MRLPCRREDFGLLRRVKMRGKGVKGMMEQRLSL